MPTSKTVLVCGNSEDRYARDETIMSALQRLPNWKVLDCRFKSDRWARFPFQGRALNNAILRIGRKTLLTRIRRAITRNQIHAALIMKLNPGYFFTVSRWTKPLQIPTIYDLWVSRYLVEHRDRVETPVASNEEHAVIQGSDYLMATTEAYREFYATAYRCDPRKIFTVPLAVPDDWLLKKPSITGNKHAFVVAYWGWFLKQHGVDVALQAAEQLNAHREIQFRFYGNPPGAVLDTLRKNANGNLEYCGYVGDRDKMIQCVDQADVCFGHLRPIHDAHLMLPNKALEGMARSKVVVHVESPLLARQYATMGMREGPVLFFKGGSFGLAESILFLRDRRRLMESIGCTARQQIVQQHSVAVVATAIQQCLESTYSKSFTG